MRSSVLLITTLTLATACFAQHRAGFYGTPTGANVLHPGGRPAPVPPGGITDPAFAGRLGANVGGHGVPLGPARVGHQHNHGGGRTVIVPYPVYYGGGYDGGYTDPGQGQQYQGPNPDNSNGAPSVVINQGFIPDRASPVVRDYPNLQDDGQQQSSGMKLYQGPPSHPYADVQARRTPRPDDPPTLYLIAFKDHTIIQALGYWMEGGNLHYVSVEHTVNQASPDLIDRELTQRLNDERNVEFRLPR